VTRPRTVRAAACLAAAVVAVGTVPVTTGTAGATTGTPRSAAAAKRAVADTPLGITMDSMTPSTIPDRGRVTVSGTVTNNSDDVWTDLQVYLFRSQTPITTRAGLSEAAVTDPATDVGARVATEGRFDEIGDLAPGETTSYTVSVSRADLALSGDPGVYWIGTHVLGAVDGVRDGLAAGKARSFMPLMDEDAEGTDLAVVMPLRGRVRRAPNGSLMGLREWQDAVSDDGRLGRIVQLASTAGSDLTWLVDPAVLEAIGSVSGDDPPFSTAPDGTGPDAGTPEEDGTATPSPSGSPSPTPTETPDPDAEDPEDPEPSAEAVTATEWLQSFRSESADDSMLALPYGDVDVAAVTANRLRGLLEESQRLSAETMAALGLTARATVAPPRGFLPARALAALDATTTVLMTDRAFPTRSGTVLGRSDGTQVVLTDAAAASGGPGPTDRLDALAVRQRLLSESALHALTPERDTPLVVTLPTRFDPGEDWQSADFFAGLDVPWLTRVGVGEVVDGGPASTTSQPPLYPASQRAAHVPLANQLAAQELEDLGRVYAELLTDNDNIHDQLAKAGLLAASYQVRGRTDPALARARETAQRVRRQLGSVEVDGPAFVSMTNEIGPIGVTVENQLEDTVTVQLEAQTESGDVEIEKPDPITLGPGQRAPVRMRARAASIGVHNVTLVATTTEGSALGSSDQFTVRSSNIGTVIWVVMGGGAALLAVAIVVRLVRRVRAYRRGEAAP
jgi:hypothetical protein